MANDYENKMGGKFCNIDGMATFDQNIFAQSTINIKKRIAYEQPNWLNAFCIGKIDENKQNSRGGKSKNSAHIFLFAKYLFVFFFRFWYFFEDYVWIRISKYYVFHNFSVWIRFMNIYGNMYSTLVHHAQTRIIVQYADFCLQLAAELLLLLFLFYSRAHLVFFILLWLVWTRAVLFKQNVPIRPTPT